MDSDLIWRHIDTQRAALCDLLEGLDPQDWDRPSLCAEWTVRDVAAHLTFAQARLRTILVPALRAGFRFNTMIEQTALRSPASHAEIISTLRGFAGSRRRAPFVSELEPLIDILVHSQDICVPLGIDHPMPPDAAVTAIERVLELNTGPFRLRGRLPDLTLQASDVDWSHGSGPVVRGPIRWLLMIESGRDIARSHLSGEAAALT